MNRVTAGAVTINKDGDERFEPLWPSFVAMLAVGGLYAALPAYLLGGAPRWLLAAIVVALLVPILILHRRHNHTLSQKLGYVLNSVITVALIVSLAFLIEQVAEPRVPPRQLLRSAAALWVSNLF